MKVLLAMFVILTNILAFMQVLKNMDDDVKRFYRSARFLGYANVSLILLGVILFV